MGRLNWNALRFSITIHAATHCRGAYLLAASGCLAPLENVSLKVRPTIRQLVAVGVYQCDFGR